MLCHQQFDLINKSKTIIAKIKQFASIMINRYLNNNNYDNKILMQKKKKKL